MSVLINIIIGFFVGLIARALMPGRNKMGFILTSVLGILGSVIATLLGQQIGWYWPGEPAGFLASIVGALILLSFINFIKQNK